MKRLVVTTVVALGMVWDSGAAAQTPTEDSVNGSGLAGFGPGSFEFTIDARSGPSGENPTGSASLTPLRFGPFQGPVTCLAVSGSKATVNFVVNDGSGVHVLTYTVTDLPTGDTIDLGVDERAPTDCSLSTAFEGSISGEITVVDAPSLPVSKDQCKNEGWQSYGVFRNQGDCVSFVATGGKNPPASSP